MKILLYGIKTINIWYNISLLAVKLMNRHEKALQKLHEGTVIPANPLALDENRQFDEKHQRAVVRYYLDAGVGGLAVAVHTTQFEIRDPKHNLLEKVLKVAKEEATKFITRLNALQFIQDYFAITGHNMRIENIKEV